MALAPDPDFIAFQAAVAGDVHQLTAAVDAARRIGADIDATLAARIAADAIVPVGPDA
jgi:hypothetical protein